jgi:hypothetical protein
MLIADIQQQLAPGSEVTHDVRLAGVDSGAMRQIDVLVRHHVGQYEILIVVDCKDYAQPVDVKGVEEFSGLLRDVRAHQGSIVCPKGFTRSARKLAKHLNIALYSPVDTGDHKWRTPLALPTLCDFRQASLAFKISTSAPQPFRLAYEFQSTLMVFNDAGEELGTCVQYALNRWNEGRYPTEVGVHDGVPTFGVNPVYVDNGYGTRIPVELSLHLEVKGRRYFGYLPLQDIRGLRDEHTGEIITNAFTTGVLDAVQVENEWQRLKDGADPPSAVALTMMGLDCFEIEGRRQR